MMYGACLCKNCNTITVRKFLSKCTQRQLASHRNRQGFHKVNAPGMYHNENDYTFVWIASLKQWPRILFSKFSQTFFRRRRIFSVTYHNRKDLVTFCVNKQTHGLP